MQSRVLVMNQTPPHDADWAAQLVDSLDSFIASIRSKTADPIARIVRYLVFGVMAIGVSVVALLLVTIGAVRGLDKLIPGDHTIWAADLILGGIFLLAGSLAWRRRHRP